MGIKLPGGAGEGGSSKKAVNFNHVYIIARNQFSDIFDLNYYHRQGLSKYEYFIEPANSGGLPGELVCCNVPL